MNDQAFEIPIAIFIYKRREKSVEIVRKIAEIAPKTIYLLSDGARSLEEWNEVISCRAAVEAAITWDCEIVKRYQDSNVGIFENIAGGVRWVFEREASAIFLEDDNLPERTFFEFCKQMLVRYEGDDRVLWICGSNYLMEYVPKNEASYVFTKNMLPCGWASWGSKFNRLYDGDLSLWLVPGVRERIKGDYFYKPLYHQDAYNFDYELDAKKRNGRFYSWDYQMAFSMRVHDVFAIVPCKNQIRNIGVDVHATHGGVSEANVMVERFCGLRTTPITFPLSHPCEMRIDEVFEYKTAQLILNPNFFSIRSRLGRVIRRIFRINRTISIRSYFFGFFHNSI